MTEKDQLPKDVAEAARAHLRLQNIATEMRAVLETCVDYVNDEGLNQQSFAPSKVSAAKDAFDKLINKE